MTEYQESELTKKVKNAIKLILFQHDGVTYEPIKTDELEQLRDLIKNIDQNFMDIKLVSREY